MRHIEYEYTDYAMNEFNLKSNYCAVAVFPGRVRIAPCPNNHSFQLKRKVFYYHPKNTNWIKFFYYTAQILDYFLFKQRKFQKKKKNNN